MIEAKKGQVIVFLTPWGELEGVIGEVEYDRIIVHILKEDVVKYKNLRVGDELKTLVHTRSGIKKMLSMLIEKTDKYISIENAPTIPEEQKREFVRVTCDFQIRVEGENFASEGQAINLSIGGIKFKINHQNKIPLNTDITLEFINCELEGMKINGNIRKTDDNGIYVAQFFKNNDMILNRISKFCIGSIS
ncbi:PilZ domain-containing protein [bacterium]|nr:PilZ domain-containing protein [bacterium]